MVDASLLHVAVEQFVERPAHPVADVRQFELLALGLIDRVDAETAAQICRPLCAHAETPRSIYERLREKGGASAALAFEFAPAPTEADMRAYADHGPVAMAVALARRKDLGRDTIAALAARSEAQVLRALAGNRDAPLDAAARRALANAARDDVTLARLLLDRADLEIDREPLFLAATRLERMAMVLEACRRTLASGAADPPRRVAPDFVARLESFALRGDREEMARLLAGSLDCRFDRLRDIVADGLGDALALALCALGVDAPSATRIFLCADPMISHDPDRVRALISLLRSTPRRAAMRIIDAIAADPRPERDAARARGDAGWRRVAGRTAQQPGALERTG